MMNIQKFKNRTLPREYLVDQLGGGLSTMATLVHKRQHFREGNFFVVVPDSVDADGLSKFAMEIPDVDHSAATQLLAGMVKRLIGNRNYLVLLQDFVHRVSDPSWEQNEFKEFAATYDTEIYWELTGPGIPDQQLEELIAYWSGYFPVAAFFCKSSPSDRKKHLVKADLENLANSLIGVAVDIFDGDSFLIWWREDLLPFPKVEAT